MEVKKQDAGADAELYPLTVTEVIERLVGNVSPRFDYGGVPLVSWPCKLVTAIAEVSEQPEVLDTYSWLGETVGKVFAVRNELTVYAVASYRLPDAFDGEVFAVLVRHAIAERRAAVRTRGDGFLWMRDLVKELALNIDDLQDYQRVSKAIEGLRGLSVVASSRVERASRKKPDYSAPRNFIVFGLLTSYERPSDEDYERSPIRIGWNDMVYDAIVAPPVHSRRQTFEQAMDRK